MYVISINTNTIDQLRTFENHNFNIQEGKMYNIVTNLCFGHTKVYTEVRKNDKQIQYVRAELNN